MSEIPNTNNNKITYPLTNILIKDLIDDPDNPNEMTDDTYKALITSLKTFGELEPIVIRKSNNMIIDGHHRVRAYRDVGYDSIYAYIIPDNELTPQRIKLMRQALNKIRGEHNIKSDVGELLSILNSKDKTDANLLIEMFSIDQQKINDMQLLLDNPSKEDWQNMLMGTTDKVNLMRTHQVVLLMDDEEYKIFNEALEHYQDSINLKFKNSTKTIISLLSQYMKNNNNNTRETKQENAIRNN